MPNALPRQILDKRVIGNIIRIIPIRKCIVKAWQEGNNGEGNQNQTRQKYKQRSILFHRRSIRGIGVLPLTN